MYERKFYLFFLLSLIFSCAQNSKRLDREPLAKNRTLSADSKRADNYRVIAEDVKNAFKIYLVSASENDSNKQLIQSAKTGAEKSVEEWEEALLDPKLSETAENLAKDQILTERENSSGSSENFSDNSKAIASLTFGGIFFLAGGAGAIWSDYKFKNLPTDEDFLDQIWLEYDVFLRKKKIYDAENFAISKFFELKDGKNYWRTRDEHAAYVDKEYSQYDEELRKKEKAKYNEFLDTYPGIEGAEITETNNYRALKPKPRNKISTNAALLIIDNYLSQFLSEDGSRIKSRDEFGKPYDEFFEKINKEREEDQKIKAGNSYEGGFEDFTEADAVNRDLGSRSLNKDELEAFTAPTKADVNQRSFITRDQYIDKVIATSNLTKHDIQPGESIASARKKVSKSNSKLNTQINDPKKLARKGIVLGVLSMLVGDGLIYYGGFSLKLVQTASPEAKLFEALQKAENKLWKQKFMDRK